MHVHGSETSRELPTVTLNDGALKTHASSRRTRFVRAARAHWHEFCSSTSLHGLQYLVRRPATERLWWVAALLVSVVACALFIGQLYRKWETTPVLVTFAETPTPIGQIPFPAVTVCTEVKVKRDAFDFTRAKFDILADNYTDTQKVNFEYASVLCNFIPNADGNRTLDPVEVVRHIEKFAPTVDDVLEDCWLKGRRVHCHEIFAPTLTDEGLCFTFNALTATEMFRDNAPTAHLSTDSTARYLVLNASWTLEGGYTPPKAGQRPYPHSTHASGAGGGLSFSYWGDEDDLADAWCRLPVVGLKVLVHSPVDYPQVQNQYFRVAPGRAVAVGVRPSLTNTSRALWSYPPAVRQCALTGERRLAHFAVYTQKNCQMECVANRTRHICNCTAFYMPHAGTDARCGAGSERCVIDVEAELMNDGEQLRKCGCASACVELEYAVETSQARTALHKLLETKQDVYRITERDTHLGYVSVYFKEMQFVTSVRSELYGLTDFMANCGGLLGLFMGFSFLSLVEFVYFFTVRLYSNVRRRRLLV